MCMEDVKIGRKTGSTQRTVTLNTTSQDVVDADAKRFSLILNAPTSGRVTYSLRPTATDLNGIVLYATMQPLVLNLKDHGAIVTSRLTAITNTGSQVTTIVETRFDD